MPKITISQQTYAGLQKWAEPFVDTEDDVLRRVFVDTPDDVLRNLFDAVGKRGARTNLDIKPIRGRVKAGESLPLCEYTDPILEALYELGGRATCKQVVDLVGTKLKNKLTDHDKRPHKQHQVVWRNRVQWQRLTLVQEGLYLKSDSPRGIWELTPAGISKVEKDLRGR